MNNLKFIVMDVDGTLLNSKKKLSKETKDALMKCQEQGIRVILASGRPSSGLAKLALELEMQKHHGMIVSYNGSKIHDCETDEILFNEPMTLIEAKAVLEHLKSFNVYPMIDKDKYMYVNNVFAPPILFQNKELNIIEYEARGGNYLLCEKSDLVAFIDFAPNKILTAGQIEYLEENYQKMMEPFKDSLSCMFTAPFYFEFTAKGIDKAKALDTALSKLGFGPENLIAFGDGHNDISMIRYAGIGIAMDNAVLELKEVADFVTDSHDFDGIAKALYQHFPEIFESEIN